MYLLRYCTVYIAWTFLIYVSYLNILNTFHRYLKHIPDEEIIVFERGEEKPTKVRRPLPRAIETVELSLKVAYAARKTHTIQYFVFECSRLFHLLYVKKL